MSDNLHNNLADLFGDVREHLSYLHEIGVERIEATFDSETTTTRVEKETHSLEKPKAFSRSKTFSKPQAQNKSKEAKDKVALARNALAASSLSTKTNEKKSSNNAVLNTERETVFTSEEKTMAAKSKPTSDTSLFGDSLFGDIAPVNELQTSNETLEDIHGDIGDCKRCGLCEGRTHIVHSEGNPQARLMFVGEAPGADEDAQARPFVGRAGQLLNKIIEAIGMKREEVFIGNINRCRPPANRAPMPDEAAACKPFLMREIAVVRPDVIVVMGNTAMKNLLGTKEGITKLRGIFQDYHGVKVMPTFHPAYLLRDPSKKRETWEDMKKVRDYLKEKQNE
jgi:DNA polymerase